MPKGRKGAKRPADVVGNAVHVTKIATDEIEGAAEEQPDPAKEHMRRGGLNYGRQAYRFETASPEEDRYRVPASS